MPKFKKLVTESIECGRIFALKFNRVKPKGSLKWELSAVPTEITVI